MDPSGTVQASLQEGGFQVSSPQLLCLVCVVLSSVIGSHFPFLAIDQYCHYFSKPWEKKTESLAME